jgi:hypothetical protein
VFLKFKGVFVKNSLQGNPDLGLHQVKFLSYSASGSQRALMGSGRRGDIDYFHFYS